MGARQQHGLIKAINRIGHDPSYLLGFDDESMTDMMRRQIFMKCEWR
jgi:hypothetical protein